MKRNELLQENAMLTQSNLALEGKLDDMEKELDKWKEMNLALLNALQWINNQATVWVRESKRFIEENVS